MNKKNLIIGFVIFSLCLGGWWLQQNAQISGENNSEDAVNTQTELVTQPTKTDNTLSQNASKKPETIPEDYFDKALALHKLAVAGDVSSQFALGRILMVCSNVALDPNTADNNLKIIQLLASKLPAMVIKVAEQIVQDCSEFHTENLRLFLPENKHELSQFETLEKSKILSQLPLYWTALAAIAGHDEAVIDLVHLDSLHAIKIKVDNPEVTAAAMKSALAKQLAVENPDLMVRLGLFTPDDEYSTKTVLMDMACEKSSKCSDLSLYKILVSAALQGLHTVVDETKLQSTDIENFEYSLGYIDLSTLIANMKNTKPDYLMQKEKVRHMLKNEPYRTGLVDKLSPSFGFLQRKED